ncbi:PfkB family carbohydrate kinase [Streptomyces sp. AC495_CC817]|uniref:PfkB family carbohydrate kinase n=1 Tax=Streptomyces sp. AC495_CC817 TaxID=2823900 RepID=UPI001C260BFB|nr:PfkB family carbohydrate kinase [Streptomyces sp. AC495_CC817]
MSNDSAAPGRVAVVGDALIDEIRDSNGVRELVGGAALNVAVGLRRLGVPTTLIAMVGDDEAGDHIREYLRDHDVQLIASAAPLGSSRAVVTRSPSGEPQYVFNEAARGRSIRYSDEARRALAEAELIAVSCFPFDVSAEVDALVDAVGDTPIAIDPNPRTGMLSDRDEFVRGFERVAAGAAIVKVGADDAALLYDGDLDALRARLRSRGAAAVLATAGSAGAVLDADAGVVSAPIATLPGRIVDTVGAGDATLAAVVAGLAAGERDWPALLHGAMEVAAATCRAEGGLLRTPKSLADAERGVHGS